MPQESPSLRGGPRWCGAPWVGSGAFSAPAPRVVRAQGHLATPPSLALTIVQGVHPRILHSLLGQLDPHNSLHLLERGQEGLMTAQPRPPGAAKEGLVQGGGAHNRKWDDRSGARGAPGWRGGAHPGQGQADGACATAHIQHRAARVQLGPVLDERVEHLSRSGVHLGVGRAVRATPPRLAPSLLPHLQLPGRPKAPPATLSLPAQEHSSVPPPTTSS